MTERSIGFVTGENSDTKWHLGTQDAIDIVSTVDEFWTNQDYEGMRPYFADSVEVFQPDGTYTNTFDSFIESLSSQEFPTWSYNCLLYTSPSPRDLSTSRMPSSA